MLDITFAPAAAGALAATIVVDGNAANAPLNIAVSGTGVAAVATLQASASTVAFGTITSGAKVTKSLTITNTGNASATIQSISTGNTAFTVSGCTLPVSIAPGATLTLTLQFTASTSGAYAGTLNVLSNATNSSLSVALSGTVSAATVSHSVSLAWSDGSTSLLGYNVYRSQQSGTGYTKVSSLGSSTSYADSTVLGGQTYYYVITAVDASGNESPYSAQVTAVVPAP